MSREAFEAWIKRDSTLSVERDGEGYKDMDVYLMWRVWPVAQADAYERAEKACNRLSVALDNAGQLYLREAPASQCADAIRAPVKPNGRDQRRA